MLEEEPTKRGIQKLMEQIMQQTSHLFEVLKDRQETITFAESCTGGILSANFVAQPGISQVFKGAVVAYSREVKENLLGVDSHLIDQFGQVSEVVAGAMANGGARKLQSDWCLSVTGVAGPEGGTKEKPVGFVCFGFVGPKVEVTKTCIFEPSLSGAALRKQVQEESVLFALKSLLKIIKKENH